MKTHGTTTVNNCNTMCWYVWIFGNSNQHSKNATRVKCICVKGSVQFNFTAIKAMPVGKFLDYCRKAAKESGSREEAKSNVEEQLITCKYKRMINRYFLCLTEMRLWFAKIVLLLTPPGDVINIKKKYLYVLNCTACIQNIANTLHIKLVFYVRCDTMI